MTEIIISRKKGEITAFEVIGHTGYAESGEDIICAGISSTVTFVECCFNDIMKLKANVAVDEENAKVLLKLPKEIGEGDKKVCTVVLETFRSYIMSLQSEYPEFIKVTEELG